MVFCHSHPNFGFFCADLAMPKLLNGAQDDKNEDDGLYFCLEILKLFGRIRLMCPFLFVT